MIWTQELCPIFFSTEDWEPASVVGKEVGKVTRVTDWTAGEE